MSVIVILDIMIIVQQKDVSNAIMLGILILLLFTLAELAIGLERLVVCFAIIVLIIEQRMT